MKTLRLIALPLLATASLLAACEEPIYEACTLIGCSPEEGVHLSLEGVIAAHGDVAPLTIEICADQTCDTFVVTETDGSFVCDADYDCYQDGGNLTVLFPAPVGDQVAVHVTIKDASGAEVLDRSETAATEEHTPNGPSCEPVCTTAKVTFQADLVVE